MRSFKGTDNTTCNNHCHIQDIQEIYRHHEPRLVALLFKRKHVRSVLQGRISPSGSLTQVRKPPGHRPCCVVTHILALGADMRQTGQSLWPTQLSPPPESETPPESSNLTRSCRKRLKTLTVVHMPPFGRLCLGVSGVGLMWGSRTLQRCSPGSFCCWHETLGE